MLRIDDAPLGVQQHCQRYHRDRIDAFAEVAHCDGGIATKPHVTRSSVGCAQTSNFRLCREPALAV